MHCINLFHMLLAIWDVSKQWSSETFYLLQKKIYQTFPWGTSAIFLNFSDFQKFITRKESRMLINAIIFFLSQESPKKLTSKNTMYISEVLLLLAVYFCRYQIIYYLKIFKCQIAMASGREYMIYIYPCVNQSSGKSESWIYRSMKKCTRSKITCHRFLDDEYRLANYSIMLQFWEIYI